MPQPKKTLPKNGLQKIRNLAERGVSETDIAKSLGMSYKTWQRIKEEDPNAKDVLEEARQIEETKLFGILFEKAMNGDSTAAMFLLKTRHGYREGAELVNANQVNVKITMPGAKDPVSYLKEVEENSHES
jgi:hypothetical protein